MLRIILWLVLLTVCSTCLVRPWFWKKFRESEGFGNFFEDFKYNIDWNSTHTSGFTWAEKVVLQLLFSIVGLLLAIIIYYTCFYRKNFYGLWLYIICCLIIQFGFFPFKKKIGNIIVVLGIILILVCGIQDSIVKNDITISLNKVESIQLTTVNNQNEEIKVFISSTEVQSLFKVDYATGPTYNNGKYIFTVEGGDTGNGIVIIDKDNYTEAKFLPCSYEFDIENIYPKYPTQRLKKLYITISDDSIPYGLFAIADKSWLLGRYNVNNYVLLNLITGEITDFTQDQLPDFVTNN